MKTPLLKLALLAACVSLAAVAQAVLKFEVTSDHADCIYRCGEKAAVTVRVSDTNGAPAKAGAFTVRLDNFGAKVEWTKRIDLAAEKGNVFTFTTTRAQPGFMRFTFASKEQVVNNSGKVADRHGNPSHEYVWGVGFCPERIVQGAPCPADFDAFWADAVRKLDAEVPEDARMTLVADRSEGPCNLYEVSFATVGGRRVGGFLSVPKAPGKHPVRINVPGAGPGVYGVRCESDAINLLMNVHYHAAARDRKETERLYAEQDKEWGGKYGVRRYCMSGISESREAYFYYGSLLGVNRAVNWLARRPDVDLADFTYSGTSQGGGFGFYLTGLNRHITRACVFVPAITDLLGSKVEGRQSGWPQLVESQLPENRAAAERFAPYFDAANFAARITVPVRVVVGFSDVTCPPAAVYSGYNAIPSRDKAIIPVPGMPHSVFGRYYRELEGWQRARVFGAAAKMAGGVDRNAKALAIEGKRLYAGGNELRVYDVSDPLGPKLLGRVGGMGNIRQIAAQDGFAYVTSREYGLWIVDATDPRKPRVRSRFDCCELATGVDVAGDVCFVGQRQNGVEFVDVSDKDRPRHIAMRKTGESQSVFYTDGILYSGEWGMGNVTVFDAHDMRDIRQIALADTWGYGDGLCAADGWLYAATGHHAKHRKVESTYVTAEMKLYGEIRPGAGMGHGLDIFDVRDPARPKRVGRVDYPPLYTRGNDMWTARLSGDGNTVFAAQTYNGVFAVDVTDRARPRTLGHWGVPNAKTPSLPGACVGSVAVGDGVIYAAVEMEGYYAIPSPRAKPWTAGKGRLPANASHREAYPNTPGWHVWRPRDVGQVRAVALKGDVAYAACGDAGLYALQVLPQGGFKELAKLPGHDRVFDVSVCGDLIYTAEGTDGVRAFRIAGPAKLEPVAALNPLLPGKTLALTVTAMEGGWLFASDRRGYDLFDVRRLPEFRHILHAGSCPGWDKYLADAPGDGRHVCYNNAHQSVMWFDLGAKPDPVVSAQTTPKNRINLSCGVCAFRDGLTLATNGGGEYRLLKPNEGDAADNGGVWRYAQLPKPKGKGIQPVGIPRSDGTNVILTCRIRRQASLFDFTDAEHPVCKGAWKFSGNPDLAVFCHGKPIVPCGYQGLIMLK